MYAAFTHGQEMVCLYVCKCVKKIIDLNRFAMLNKYRRTLAIFLSLILFTDILAPTVTYALTAGPTAPEATSFEPVDTTDIVNILTGDLVYNIPLLEVPGPSGGYPLALSYHAGIQPNEESSWVGLGFSLNPGAIVRNVNGFADDHKDVLNMTRYYWDGGTTHSYSIGVTVGIPGTPASVSASLSYSQDTYQGVGVGAYAGVGGSVLKGNSNEPTPFSINATIGVNGYGDTYASMGAGLSLGKGANSAKGLSVGPSVSFSGTRVASGFRVSASELGVSLHTGSKGIAANVSLAGASFVSNNNAGKVSSSSLGASIPIPVIPGKVWLSLGYDYQRYWIDAMNNVSVTGSLYDNDLPTNPGLAHFENNAFDSYSLFDSELPGGVIDNPMPEKVLGGSFPSYDNYSVHAQGLFGDMRPYYFQRYLYNRNNFTTDSEGNKDYQTIHYYLGGDQMEPEFRFINDFSNRFEYTAGTIDHQENTDFPLAFDFDGPVVKGESGTELYENNLLPGSRHIEYLTNNDIVNETEKFLESKLIDTRSTGFVRSAEGKAGDLLGGFVITNESGVKYHFALPAYSYGEYFRSENNTKVETFNEYSKPDPYAYTWYLTAITGPDYVDRSWNGNPDGILNSYDWGYWVEFEYGKWTDTYHWRNPSEGMDEDIDSDFKNFSEGRKELYYLDAIRTKSHTALFFKDVRHDAKSSLYFLPNTINFHKKITENEREGGFIPKETRCICEKVWVAGGGVSYADAGFTDYRPVPTSSLKLSSVILIDNERLNGIPLHKTDGSNFQQLQTYNWTVIDDGYPNGLPQCDFSSVTINHHLYQNVYDVEDFNNVKNSLEAEAVRVIEFGTDYSLSPGTSNSFDFSLLNPASPSTNPDDYPLHGKLTLKELRFFGKGKSDPLPPMKFTYDLQKYISGTAHVTVEATDTEGNTVGSFNLPSSEFTEGDIITFIRDAKNYYALIERIHSDTHHIKILGKNIPPTGAYHFRQTKNPPYDKDAYDCWGMYKSDYRRSEAEHATRIVTGISAKSKDAWSLRSVTTVTGAEFFINYESDSYRKPVMHKSGLLKIKSLSRIDGTNRYKLQLYDHASNLNEVIKSGDQLHYLFDLAAPVQTTLETGCDGGTVPDEYIHNFIWDIYEGELTVHSIYEESGDWYIETSNDFSSYFVERPDVTESSTCLTTIIEYWTPFFIAGNLTHANDFKNVGGDLRVTSLQLTNLLHSSKTIYEYDHDGIEQGVTSYEPHGMEQAIFEFPQTFPWDLFFENEARRETAKQEYRKKLHTGFTSLLMNAREIPPPGVSYEHVTVKESSINEGVETILPERATYQFEVFHEGMVDIEYLDDQATTYNQHVFYNTIIGYKKKETRNVVLKDYTSRLGSLKRVTLYHGDQKISETINHYLHDGIEDELLSEGYSGNQLRADANKQVYEDRLAQFNDQGVTEETYATAKFVRLKDEPGFSLSGVASKREQFPVIQTGQEVINYKTGITNKTYSLAFDFYSGQATKTKSVDGYGNTFVNQTIPAYRQYPAMGPLSMGGVNMLTQQAASYTYKADPNANDHIVSLVDASVQTWSNSIPVLTEGLQPGIWRKHASYSFIGDNNVAMTGDGLYPAIHQFPEFTAWNMHDAVPAGWQKNGEITLYDVHSHALEAADLNEKYAATKMSSDQTTVFASAANTRYDAFAYSGAEDKLVSGKYGGDVERVDGMEVFKSGETDFATTHTGRKALRITSPSHKAFRYTITTEAGRWYHASVWTNQNFGKLYYSINGGTAHGAATNENKKAGSWYLVSIDIPPSPQGATLEVWCGTTDNGSPVHFDDFRVHPLDAAMTSYVYNQWGELSHILDNNNLYTEYRYDGMGRLKETLRETFSHEVVKTSELTYHYQQTED